MHSGLVCGCGIEQFDGMGEFHHSNADTMDKLSPHSLEVVGKTILLTVELLDK